MVSSAYNNVNNGKNTSMFKLYMLLLQKTCSPLKLLDMCCSKSFRNNANSKGERFSPCRTPILQVKKLDSMLSYLTQDLVCSYKLYNTLNSLPDMLHLSSFCQSIVLFIKSKAFL